MLALPPTVVPLRYHTKTTPVVALRKTRSAWPSLFQSATCATSHDGSIEKIGGLDAPRLTLEPFQSVYQANARPLEELRNSRSGLPSRLKSPTPCTFQAGSMEKRNWSPVATTPL